MTDTPDTTWAPPDRPCEICGKPTPLLVDGRRIHALGCEQPDTHQTKGETNG